MSEKTDQQTARKLIDDLFSNYGTGPALDIVMKAIAAEREACAAIAGDVAVEYRRRGYEDQAATAEMIRDAISQRGSRE